MCVYWKSPQLVEGGAGEEGDALLSNMACLYCSSYRVASHRGGHGHVHLCVSEIKAWPLPVKGSGGEEGRGGHTKYGISICTCV